MRYTISDSDARTNDHISAYPAIASDAHRFTPLGVSTRDRIGRMASRVDVNTRAEERVASDTDLGHVEHDAAEVGVHAFFQVDVRTVVAVERRLDHVLVVCAQKLSQDLCARFWVCWDRVV